MADSLGHGGSFGHRPFPPPEYGVGDQKWCHDINAQGFRSTSLQATIGVYYLSELDTKAQHQHGLEDRLEPRSVMMSMSVPSIDSRLRKPVSKVRHQSLQRSPSSITSQNCSWTATDCARPPSQSQLSQRGKTNYDSPCQIGRL